MFVVIMIAGGASRINGARTTVELLYGNGTYLCTLPPLPVARSQHSQSGRTLCGAWGGVTDDSITSCTTFRNGTWLRSHNLTGRWNGHLSFWESPRGLLLMGIGGTNKTELLLDSGATEESFQLVGGG